MESMIYLLTAAHSFCVHVSSLPKMIFFVCRNSVEARESLGKLLEHFGEVVSSDAKYVMQCARKRGNQSPHMVKGVVSCSCWLWKTSGIKCSIFSLLTTTPPPLFLKLSGDFVNWAAIHTTLTALTCHDNLNTISFPGDRNELKQNTQRGNNCLFPPWTDIIALIVEEWGLLTVCMNAALLHNKASGGVRQTPGAGPSKQLPCPCRTNFTQLGVQQLPRPTHPNVKSSFE